MPTRRYEREKQWPQLIDALRAAGLRAHTRIFKAWDDRDTAVGAEVKRTGAHLMSQVLDPTLRAVLEHQQPVLEPDGAGAVCRGCDCDDEETEPPTWPCSIWTLLVNQVAQPRSA